MDWDAWVIAPTQLSIDTRAVWQLSLIIFQLRINIDDKLITLIIIFAIIIFAHDSDSDVSLLLSNYSVQFLPFPLHDVSACMRTAPERTDAVMRRIQDALCRNVAPTRHSSQQQALRLHQVSHV